MILKYLIEDLIFHTNLESPKQAHALPLDHIKDSLAQYLFLKEFEELVYKIQSKGDKTHPWGDPIEVIILSETDPPNLTCWVRRDITNLFSSENSFARISANIVGDILLQADEKSTNKILWFL